jgi:hypothetical protein
MRLGGDGLVVLKRRLRRWSQRLGRRKKPILKLTDSQTCSHWQMRQASSTPFGELWTKRAGWISVRIANDKHANRTWLQRSETDKALKFPDAEQLAPTPGVKRFSDFDVEDFHRVEVRPHHDRYRPLITVTLDNNSESAHFLSRRFESSATHQLTRGE